MRGNAVEGKEVPTNSSSGGRGNLVENGWNYLWAKGGEWKEFGNEKK
jgi:hypothetical protein